MKCAFYIRVVSEQPEDQMESMIGQEHQLKTFAQIHGFEVVKTYKQVASEMSTETLKDIATDRRKGMFNYLICTSYDRIARKYQTFLWVVKTLKSMGITVATPKHSEEELMATINKLMIRMEHGLKSDSIKRSLALKKYEQSK